MNTASDAKIFSARRAYEFPMDALRLTLLTRLQPQIQQAFAFQSSQIGTPLPTFGPVITVSPPGMAFGEGTFAKGDGLLVPIRFFHIEPRRIVIDVASSSDAIDPIYEHLCAILADVRAADGFPAIGSYSDTLDSSEIVIRLPFGPEQLVVPSLRPIVKGLLTRGASEVASVLVPFLQLRAQFPDRDYEGAVYPFPILQLETRGGTKPEDHIYYSAAPLRTDDHLALLERIGAALAEVG